LPRLEVTFSEQVNGLLSVGYEELEPAACNLRKMEGF